MNVRVNSGVNVLGAVLAGGQSRRMGTAKALVEIAGIPMARRVADVLLAAGCEKVIAVGGDSGLLGSIGLEVVPDEHPGEGPVGGVLTALGRARAEGVPAAFIVACDLPHLDVDSLNALLRAAEQHPGPDVVIARTDRLEPLCALWRTSALESVRVAFDAGVRSMHVVVGRLDICTVDVAACALQNVNTPEDVAAAE